MCKKLNDNTVFVNVSRADFDAAKMAITLAQAAQWYECETGKKQSAKPHEVRFGTRGSVSLSDKNGFVEYFDHESEAGGSVIDMIMTVRGCDAATALEVARAEILREPTTATASAHAPTATASAHAPTADRAALYADLLRSIEKTAREGLKSADFKRMCEARGFDAATVAGLPTFGYCAENLQLADTYKKHGVESRAYIGAHSLVFWDGAQIKAIPLQPEKSYHRNGAFQLVTGAGDCHWTPCALDTGTICITEGETSAIALICAGYKAIPRKNDALRAAQIPDGCRVALAYDNDNSGRGFTRAALEILPDAVDISQLWGDGCDPNDFLIARGKEASDVIAQALAQSDGEADPDAAGLDPTNLQSIRGYFQAKARRNVTEAERRAMSDPLFGLFVRLLDPYRMRKHAPACVFIAYGLVRLARYEIVAPSNPRIVNLVSRSGAGKNWTLGTLRGSHSLYYQLRQEPGVDAETSEAASVTGEGLSLAAYLWASEPQNAARVRVGVWSEFGNAQTRGYSQEERAGSIGNYDVALCAGNIQKPKSKKDVKELKGLAQEYPLNGVEIRAFQNINGSKVVIPRFAGSGEARREFWLYMTTPTDDPAFDDHTVVYADEALRSSAFMPADCDEAFGLLRETALPFEPIAPYFDADQEKRIKTRSTCPEYLAAYDAILKTVTNTFYRANKCELLRDKLTFCAGLSAGLHGRMEATESDYWISAYLCECLADSLDSIMDAGGREEEPGTERARIVDRLQAVGAKGVRSDKLTTNKKLLAELACEVRGKDGAFIFDTDAAIFWRYEAKMHRRYFLKTPEIVREVDKQKDRFRKP